MKKIAIFIALIFIIFSPFFMKTAGVAYAQTAPIQSSLDVNDGIENAVDKNCSGWSNPFTANCLLYAFYNVILEPSFWLVGVAANILDFFLGYSLDSNAYRSEFVEKGWALIRDICNVAFIFTLLYLAIRHILGMSAKKAIPTLIIVALLLNFSLFFTKIVIDAGNILARAFYNSITISNDPNYANAEGYKSITYGIVDKINPQNLLSMGIFQSGSTNFIAEFDNSTGQPVGNITPKIEKTGTIFAVFILMVIVNGFLMWTFVSVALLFVGRVIGLWFSMIFSPVAFITLAVPGSGGFLKQMSFDSWKDTVLKLAFMAPIFIFFLYLTISFLSIFGSGPVVPNEGGDPFINLMKVFIPFIFIIVLLQVAKKTADSVAGEFGSMVKSIVGKVAGFTAGGALGATAFVGRTTLGRMASARLSGGNYNSRISDATQRVEDAKKSGDILSHARALADLKRLEMSKVSLEKIKNSTFDIRNAGKAKGIIGAMGRGGGWIASQGMIGFGGDKFNTGKGGDQTRKKYEDEKEKEKLQKAEDLEKVERNELSPILERALKRGDSEAEIMLHVDKMLSDLDKSMQKLDQSSDLYKQKEAEYARLRSMKSEVSAAGGDMSKISEIIKNGKVIDPVTGEVVNYDPAIHGQNGWRGTSTEVKEKNKKRRNQYADRVDNDTWYSINTGENEFTADKIRREDKVKSEEQKALDILKKALKDEESITPPTTNNNNP